MPKAKKAYSTAVTILPLEDEPLYNKRTLNILKNGFKGLGVTIKSNRHTRALTITCPNHERTLDILDKIVQTAFQTAVKGNSLIRVERRVPPPKSFFEKMSLKR